MFEPVHGSAPDIAGQNIADPTAAILSGAMLARHLGYIDIADAIQSAVVADLAERGEDQASTTEVGERIRGRLR